MIFHDLEKLKIYPHKGYLAAYYPTHPYAWKGSGLVYYHRLIMENHLGHYLIPKEKIHHIDENPINNNIENLEVLSNAEHRRKHTLRKRREGFCKKCNKKFLMRCSSSLYCSELCSDNSHRKIEIRPSPDELKRLVWSRPTLEISKDFGVSDKCIEKWCIAAGVQKPPRGYWQKLKSNKTE